MIAMVDVDAEEMSKFDGRGINVDVRIHARLSDFLRVMRPQLDAFQKPDWSEWKARISRWKKVFPADSSPVPPAEHECVDAYEFARALSTVLPSDALLYVDTGGNLTWTCNGLAPKPGQSVHSAWNNTPMGYALPAAIGAAFYNPNRSLTCIIGDGGLMLSLAELATVARHQLPIKILLFNNHGHGIQKQTLETWLGGRYVGVDSASGLALPTDFRSVAEALGLSACTINNGRSMLDILAEVYSRPGPAFINVEINPEQKLYPVVKFGSPLENQLPLIDEAKLQSEMLIPPFLDNGKGQSMRQQAMQGW